VGGLITGAVNDFSCEAVLKVLPRSAGAKGEIATNILAALGDKNLPLAQSKLARGAAA
jgi:hypothetical protein